MLKISFIIPIYNVELYICRCIDSILNQSLNKEDYEIVLVNDGSTDNSKAIAEKYVLEHENICLINQENNGVSSARNIGLEKSNGQYIWFIDSDDWIEHDCCLRLYEICNKEQLDCLWIKWKRVHEKGIDLLPIKTDIKNEITDTVSGEYFLKHIFGSACYTPSFIWRRDFLIKNSFNFKKGIVYEDAEFIPRVVIEAQRVKYEPIICYYYWIRSNSISHNYNPKKVEDLISVLKSIDHTIQKYQTQKDVSYFHRLYRDLAFMVINLSASRKYRDFDKPEIMQQIKPDIIYSGSFLMRLRTFFFNNFPQLYYKIIYCIKSIA